MKLSSLRYAINNSILARALLYVGLCVLFLAALSFRHHYAEYRANRVCEEARKETSFSRFRAAMRAAGHDMVERQERGEKVLRLYFSGLFTEHFVCEVSARGDAVYSVQVDFED